jgi:hypothetical protein
MEQYITQISRIIYTLNLVNVHGEENLDSQLASIRALKQLRETMLKEGERLAAENQ